MRYHYLRLFVQGKERPPILVMTGGIPEATTRQEYLQKIFSRRIDFNHRKKGFVYVPVGVEEKNGSPVLLGRVGRLRTLTENQPPEHGFEEILHTGWRAANMLVDSRDFADGQKIAFQARHDVGRPLSIVASLVEHINEQNPDSGWSIVVNLVTEKANFWDVYQRNRGNITEAIFTFTTPNILRMRTQLNADLRRASDEHNARTVTESLGNPDGDLELEGQDVEDSLDYIAEGGGNSKLKSGRKILYDSEKDEKYFGIIDDEPLTQENKSTWKRFCDILFR